MLALGFTFINVVNLQNERHNPFKGSDGTYADFKIALVVSVVLFFASSIVVLRQNYDLSSYCNSNHVHEMVAPILDTIDVKAPLHQLFISIEKMNYMASVATPQCHIYSDHEVFKYNYFLWTTGYFLGLQFTHMDNGFF